MRETEVGVLKSKYEAHTVQLETAIRSREEIMIRKHEEVMTMNDSVYQNVQRKR